VAFDARHFFGRLEASRPRPWTLLAEWHPPGDAGSRGQKLDGADGKGKRDVTVRRPERTPAVPEATELPAVRSDRF
jgi:hypothetical protein